MKSFTRFFKCLIFSAFLVLSSCGETSLEPEITRDNWLTSIPEEQGMDSQLLQQAIEQGEERGYVDCILVIRNGYIVTEEYFNGFNRETPHNVMSVSKSFLSAMTGIALKEEYLDSLEVKMLDYFPEYIYQSIDPRKFDITIRHLLMMRMGIDHEENNYFYIYNSSNWIKTTIELPLLYDPGTRFRYNTFETHLVSAIITKTSGMSTMEFAKKYLLDKLNINCTEWWQDPQGYFFGGNSMHFIPRDMARLGYLYMNKGKLDGNQIISPGWIEESLTDYTNFINFSWGDLDNYGYGYLWWLGEIKTHKTFLAIGYGGQFVINFPDLNLIVVTTADWQLDWATADEHEKSVLNIVADYIVPAVTN